MSSLDNPLPKRAYTLDLSLTADSVDALIGQLNGIIFHLRNEDVVTTNIISGGYDSGYVLDIIVDPTQSHDKFMQDLDAWIKRNDDVQNNDVA